MTGTHGRDPATLVSAYAATLPYPMDPFQSASCRAMLDGDGVLVCAPTGSGKTVVGEFGAWLAIETGTRTFYTTPMKALSNQKFRDLRATYGENAVGLLTGDHQINGDAAIVVMTTEVLRNMLVERSSALDGLGVVVLDEVHYLGDRERGATWEEVIIHLAPAVRIVALSATVSNHERFAAWLSALRGEVACVVETHRPVPIEHHLFASGSLVPLLDADGRGPSDAAKRASRPISPKGPPDRRRRNDRGRTPRAFVDRPAVIERLHRDGLLPAICFVFSRTGCDRAVDEVVARAVRLTTPEERDRIDTLARERTSMLSASDREALGFQRWLDGLRAGVAAHHAGLIPAFKEVVEELFTEALVKVVYATETLALGINMPARTVVIERVTKFGGDGHQVLSAGQYTQLMGRAGRRGLDDVGHGVVLAQNDVPIATIAELASGDAFPLRSAFRPSYNMAVNLLARMDRAAARELIGRSFAQFLADEEIVTAEGRLVRSEAFLASYRDHLACNCGDVWAWWKERQDADRVRTANARQERERAEKLIIQVLAQATPGSVLAVDGRRFIVTERRRTRRGEVRLYGLDDTGEPGRLSTATLRSVPVELGVLDLPRKGPHDPGFLDAIARALDALPAAPVSLAHGEAASDEPVEHPVARCEHRKAHEHWCRQIDTLERDVSRLRSSVRRRTGALARALDAVIEILHQLGLLDEDDTVTPAGRALARVYAGSDLLIVEAIRRGCFDGLDPAELASALSTIVFEGKPGLGPPEDPPTERIRGAVRRLERIAAELQEAEEERRLELTGSIDRGLAAAVYWWARGEDLQTAILDDRIQPGDFVRWVKQIDDLLRQLATNDLDAALQDVAREASGLIRRGVVDLGAG